MIMSEAFLLSEVQILPFLLGEKNVQNFVQCNNESLYNTLINSQALFIIKYEATREEVINRDNQMLYKKMDHIMRTGGRTDHKNNSLCYSKR